ncbi:MAG: hypothetical protein ACR2IE_14095 [Candidatus Sumerlaeaceae bacterium]
MTLGWIYLTSMIGTAIVVAVVYSAAQEAHLPPLGVLRQSLRRFAKLTGVLVVLAVLVYILGKI